MLTKLTAKRQWHVDVEQFRRLWRPLPRSITYAVRQVRAASLRRYGLHLSVALAATMAVLIPGLASAGFTIALPVTRSAVSARGIDDSVSARMRADLGSLRAGSAVLALAEPAVLERQGLPRTTEADYPEVKVASYQVQSGDTLYTISARFGLDVRTLFWANQPLIRQPDALAIGQELALLPIDGAYHTVAEGETVDSIAAKYQVLPEAIVSYSANNLPDPAHLSVGSTLVIPGAKLPDLPPRVVGAPASDSASSGETYTAAPGDQSGTGSLMWPVGGTVSQTSHSGHVAVDIAGPVGTRVVAADAGTVVLVSWMRTSYGYHIIIDHGNGLETLYGHLSEIGVEVGQTVNKGDAIGARGSTGRSTGPHLHFEVRESGVKRNPFSYLP